jgi:hypothetical protein
MDTYRQGNLYKLYLLINSWLDGRRQQSNQLPDVERLHDLWLLSMVLRDCSGIMVGFASVVYETMSLSPFNRNGLGRGQTFEIVW